MKKILILTTFLLIPLTTYAIPASVDRLTDHIEPLIKSDYVKSQYFTATSTTAESTFPRFTSTNGTTTNATSTNLSVSQSLFAPFLTSALLQTDASGQFGEYSGTSCTNQVTTALSALGIATCSSINNNYWSGTALSIANGGTGATSYGALRIPFVNSGNTAFTSDADLTYNATGDTLLLSTNSEIQFGSVVPGVAYSNAISVNQTASQANHLIMHNNDTTGFGGFTLSNGAAWNSNFGRMLMFGGSHAVNYYMASDSVANTDMIIFHSQGLSGGFTIGSPDTGPVRIMQNDRERLKVDAAAVSWNSGKLDLDYKIAGDNDTNLFYLDAGRDTVGIGTSSPYAKLSVVGETVSEYFTATSTATSTFNGAIAVTENATSTFAGGISLSSGCVTVNSTCLTSTNQTPWTQDIDADNFSITNIGASHVASLGDASPSNSYAAYFTSAGIEVSLASSDQGKGGSFTSGSYTANLVDTDDGSAGYFTNGTNIVNISNSANAILTQGRIYVQTGDLLVGSGNTGLGTTTPFSKLHVSNGASATTTVTIGEIGLSTSKGCVNMNQANGSAGSFYIAGGVLVVENNYCK